MGVVSVVLNIFTLLVVALVFRITFIAFNKREARNETWLQVFERVWSSEDQVNNLREQYEKEFDNLETAIAEEK